MAKTLTREDIKIAAANLGLDPCTIQAVVSVESAGSGFLTDGRTKILFEGHIFWKELQKRGIDPAPLAAQNSNIIYPKWDKSKYKGGAGEWSRLEAAMQINKEAALCSASYGLFQIMGFNYKAAGFSNVQSYVDAQTVGEAEQLNAFCNFMKSEGLVTFLKNQDWAGFARRYNGPGYAQNQYDVKLSQAYGKCKRR